MKKVYSAPDIFFDSFALNENIASANSNCNRNVTTMSSNRCGIDFGGKIVFTVAANGCIFKVQDGHPMFDGLCYHIPSADARLFNS